MKDIWCYYAVVTCENEWITGNRVVSIFVMLLFTWRRCLDINRLSILDDPMRSDSPQLYMVYLAWAHQPTIQGNILIITSSRKLWSPFILSLVWKICWNIYYFLNIIKANKVTVLTKFKNIGRLYVHLNYFSSKNFLYIF